MCLVDAIQEEVVLVGDALVVREGAIPRIARLFARTQAAGGEDAVRARRELLRFASFLEDRAPRVSAFVFGLLAAATDMDRLAAEWSQASRRAIGGPGSPREPSRTAPAARGPVPSPLPSSAPGSTLRFLYTRGQRSPRHSKGSS